MYYFDNPELPEYYPNSLGRVDYVCLMHELHADKDCIPNHSETISIKMAEVLCYKYKRRDLFNLYVSYGKALKAIKKVEEDIRIAELYIEIGKRIKEVEYLQEKKKGDADNE